MASKTIRDEPEPIPYAFVRCRGDLLGSPNASYSCGKVVLSEDQYIRQMDRPDSLWSCPTCGSTADFDDVAFEELHNIA